MKVNELIKAYKELSASDRTIFNSEYIKINNIIEPTDLDIPIDNIEYAIPINPPKFVKLDTIALRLRGNEYYRDGGQYGIGFKLIDGILMSWYPSWKHLHKKELIEITKEEWEKSNGQYAPNI